VSADRLASIEAVEAAIEKTLAPLGLQIQSTTWKRDLDKGKLALTIRVVGLTDEQLALFGGGKP
jgi:hypothetical protein